MVTGSCPATASRNPGRLAPVVASYQIGIVTSQIASAQTVPTTTNSMIESGRFTAT